MQRYNNMCKLLKAIALVKRKSAIYFLILPKISQYLESLKIKFFLSVREQIIIFYNSCASFDPKI